MPAGVGTSVDQRQEHVSPVEGKARRGPEARSLALPAARPENKGMPCQTCHAGTNAGTMARTGSSARPPLPFRLPPVTPGSIHRVVGRVRSSCRLTPTDRQAGARHLGLAVRTSSGFPRILLTRVFAVQAAPGPAARRAHCGDSGRRECGACCQEQMQATKKAASATCLCAFCLTAIDGCWRSGRDSNPRPPA